MQTYNLEEQIHKKHAEHSRELFKDYSVYHCT